MILKNLIASIWQKAACTNDRLFRKGCDFSSWETNDELGIPEGKGNKYQPSSDGLIKVLDKLQVREDACIIDIGCGKGKAMYMMSKFPFKEINGIDLSEEMVSIANANFSRLAEPRCVAINADAESYSDYDKYTFFYMFNSVPKGVFEKTMKNICDNIKKNPRTCYFIYHNPVYSSWVENNTGFRLVARKKGVLGWLDYHIFEYKLEECL